MRLRPAVVAISLAAGAAALGGCSDPPALPPLDPAPVGAPIAGTPIDATPDAGTPSAADPQPDAGGPPKADPPTAVAGDPAVAAPPTGDAPPSAPAPGTAAGGSDLGDVSARAEALPEDDPPVVVPTPIPPGAQDPSKPALDERAGARAAAGDPVAPKDPVAQKDPAAAKAPDGGARPDDDEADAAPRLLTFETLASFEYLPPDPEVPGSEAKALASIPDEIRRLDGEWAAVEGYMIPLEYKDEGVGSFLLSRHQLGCCFGVMPRANELIEVVMPDGQVAPYISYLAVIVTGRLRVGPKEGASAVLSGIYRLEKPSVELPTEEDDGR